MFKSTLILLLISSVFSSKLDDDWETFKTKYNKIYENPMIEKLRRQIFFENYKKITLHNQMFENNVDNLSFKTEINQFGDLLNTEFVNMMNGLRPELKFTNSQPIYFIPPPDDISIPKFVDWRKQGAVTDIKDQGTCGSCWAFSATGALEGQHFRKTKKLVSLSEQNLIDCSWKYGNNGCEGGLMDNAFLYVKNNKGIDTEVTYPYHMVDGKCHYNKKNSGASDSGYVDLPSGDEIKLQQAVATIGPISVGIDASHDSFQFYKHGIYFEKNCSTKQLDHGVLVVGYGTENGSDYWIVKNSWGKSWGDDGYIKMARNKRNNCGIATMASYPIN